MAGQLAIYAGGVPHLFFLLTPAGVIHLVGTIGHSVVLSSHVPVPERRLANWLVVTGWIALLAAAAIIPFCHSTGTS